MGYLIPKHHNPQEIADWRQMQSRGIGFMRNQTIPTRIRKYSRSGVPIVKRND